MSQRNFKEDLTGQKFSRLRVLGFSHFDKWNKGHWLCCCDCGGITTVETHQLKAGKTKSCGCYKGELAGDRTRTHDETGTKLYWVWSAMIQRCTNPNNKGFKNYGARGITVCDEWRDFSNFKRWADSSGYAEGLTIDRENNDKGYSPDNCRWTTRKEQSTNRRNTHFLTVNGETLSITDWARKTGVDRKTIRDRLKSGCSPEMAIQRGYLRGGKLTTEYRKGGGDA